MSYQNFTTADFAEDPFFRKWVLAKDPDAALFFVTWLERHPEKADEVNEAKALIYALQGRSDLPDEGEIERQVGATLARLGHSLYLKKTFFSRLLHSTLTAAAILAFLAGAGWYFFNFQEVGKSRANLSSFELAGKIRVKTGEKESRELRLSDGSKVLLGPNSELIFPEYFDSLSREVRLHGVAYFEISRDIRKIFRVISPDLVTEVLGTSFTVNSFEYSPEASVLVRTGMVSVLPLNAGSNQQDKKTNNSSQAEGILLTPNQEAVYHRQEAKLLKKLTPNPEIVVEVPKSDLLFDAMPLKEVLKTISTQYGVHIVYNEDILANCFFTGDLSDNTLYEQLGFICRIAHARYEIVEGQVVIHSAGCPDTPNN